MITISITEEVSDNQAMADLLRNIAEQIENGMTSGFYPHWDLSGDEEEGEDDE